MYRDITQRAELGVDGNCGFALLGPDIQAGEAEFVEIRYGSNDATHSDRLEMAERAHEATLSACKTALVSLRKRLNAPNMRYYFGPSHPYGG